MFGYTIGTGVHTPPQGMRVKSATPVGVSTTFKAKATQQTPLGGSRLPFTPNSHSSNFDYDTGSPIETFSSLVDCDFSEITITSGYLWIVVA